MPLETFSEAWDRFKEMLRKCPQHGFPEDQQVGFFYAGLNGSERMLVDASSGGSILGQTPERAIAICEEIALNTGQWAMDRVAGLYEKEKIAKMEEVCLQQVKKVEVPNEDVTDKAITEILKRMNASMQVTPTSTPMVNQQMLANPPHVMSIPLMNQQVFPNFQQGVSTPSMGQSSQSCQMPTSIPQQGMSSNSWSPSEMTLEEVAFMQGRNFQGNYGGNFGNNGGGYPQRQGGWGQGNFQGNFNQPRRYENLSYGNQSNALTLPPGIHPVEKAPNDEGKSTMSTLEDKMTKMFDFMKQEKQENERKFGYVKQRDEVNENRFKAIETHISQMATEQGEMHRKGKFPSTTVTNPKEQCLYVTVCNLESKVEKKLVETTNIVSKVEEVVVDEVVSKVEKEVANDDELSFDDERIIDEFLSSFVDESKGEKKLWLEQDHGIVEVDTSLKVEDPGKFVLTCKIRNGEYLNAICDLGSSINVMHLEVFEKLDIGKLKETDVEIGIMDGSMIKPHGVVEDMLVQIEEFVFPVDFMVVDKQADPLIPLIFGRPFLATGRAKFDMDRKEVTLRSNEKELVLSSKNLKGGDLHLKPPIKPPDDRDRVVSELLKDEELTNFVFEFAEKFSLKRNKFGGDPRVNWKIDKEPPGFENISKRVNELSSSVKGARSVDKKVVKEMFKVKMRPDGVLDFSDC